MKAARFVAVFLIMCMVSLTNPSLIFASVIDKKKVEISEIKEQLSALNNRFEEAVEDYNEVTTDLGGVKQKVRKNKLKLAENLLDIKAKEVVLSSRMRSMYKEGSFSLIVTLVQSKSLLQFFDLMFLVNRIAKKDNTMIDDLKVAEQKLEGIDNELNEQKAKQEVLANKVASKRVAINKAKEKKKSLLFSVRKDLSRLQAEERERIKKIREEALRKLREQQQSTQTAPAYNGGNPGSRTDVVEIGKKYLGVRYQWGGTTPERGFDCSGFVKFVYEQIGVSLPRTSRQQYSYLSGKGRLVSKGNLAPGDLIFYGPGSVNDVKMYMGAGYIIGANGGQFITGEVRILPLNYRSDFIAAGRP